VIALQDLQDSTAKSRFRVLSIPVKTQETVKIQPISASIHVTAPANTPGPTAKHLFHVNSNLVQSLRFPARIHWISSISLASAMSFTQEICAIRSFPALTLKKIV
jgi:hypothetical protein